MGFFDKIQETITSAADQTKAKADEVQLKRDRQKKLDLLGEQVYNLYLNGQLSHQELAPACQEIAGIDQKIAAGQAARPQPAAPGAPGQPPAPPTQAPAPPAAPTPPPTQAPAPPPPAAPPPPPPGQDEG